MEKECEKKMKWNEEYEKLDAFEQSEFWTAPTGKHRVKILNEPELKYNDKLQVEQLWMDILVDDKLYIWTRARTRTPTSCYGQLCILARHNDNKLKDVEFDLLIAGIGKKKSYSIPEAMVLWAENPPISSMPEIEEEEIL